MKLRKILSITLFALLFAAPAFAAGPWYVDPTAVGTGDGLSWVNAKTTLAATATGASAGDQIYFAGGQTDTLASAMTITMPGTATSPNRVFCAKTAANGGTVPPVTADLLTTCIVSTTGTSTLALNGSAYYYGFKFSGASGAGSLNAVTIAQTNQNLFSCELCSIGTADTSVSTIAAVFGTQTASTASTIRLKNTTIFVGNAGQKIALSNGQVTWRNNQSGTTTGSAIGATVPTTLFSCIGMGNMLLSGVDLSSETGNLVDYSSNNGCRIFFANDKLGASVAVVTGTPVSPTSPQVFIQHSDSTSHNYRQEGWQYQGNWVDDESTVLIGGWTDGTTPWSLKATTRSTATLASPLEVPIPMQWVDDTAAHTMTIELLSSTTLTNADICVRNEVLKDASFPDSSFDTSTCVGDFLPSTGTSNQSAGAGTGQWANLPSTPVSQKLAVTATPGMKGPWQPVVVIYKPTLTVWISSLQNMVP